jgi:H3 lysine-79-specific histone-lysine N-methyltransferase
LNNKILLKLLDLKEGCRIVSLRSFVAYNHQIKARNIDDPKNLLRVVKKEYFSGSVSWTDVGGDYFIATKDTSRLKRFHDKSG